jgi:hypothetical protein
MCQFPAGLHATGAAGRSRATSSVSRARTSSGMAIAVNKRIVVTF